MVKVRFNKRRGDEWMKNSLELLERERELALAELVKFSENREYYDEKKIEKFRKNTIRLALGTEKD